MRAMQPFYFSERYKQLLSQARSQAARRQHSAVSVEHLLLALVEEARSGESFLARSGADLPAFQAALEAELRAEMTAENEQESLEIPYRRQAKESIEVSMRIAKRLGDAGIEPEHLLLGVAEAVTDESREMFEAVGLSFPALEARYQAERAA